MAKKMGKVHYIPADIGKEITTAESDSCPPLEDLQAYVGGLIELVIVNFNGERCDMITNEDGRDVLPVNQRATALYTQEIVKQVHDEIRRTGKPAPAVSLEGMQIAGDVVLLEGIKLP